MTGVRICESHESLVELLPTARLRVRSMYASMAYPGAQTTVMVRASVADALHSVAELLPRGLALCVWDGLRPLSVQEEVRQRFRDELRSRGCPGAQLDAEVNRFVSPIPSSRAELEAAPPAHSTGGAVDLTLVGHRGEKLGLGEFDDFRDVARPDHFEGAGVSDAPKGAPVRLRRILHHAMTSAGFVAYHAEWWHYEMGTRRAAAALGHPTARFGIAPPAWA